MLTTQTKRLHKILSIICCICMAVGLLGGLEKSTIISKASSYPSDYRYWCQGASDDADMRKYGCWVTAQAKLLYETGVDRSGGFNPDSYLNWQRANGLINSGFYQTNGGNAPSIYASQKGKTLTYMGDWSATSNQLWFNISAGYNTIVKVKSNPYHYVLLANELSKEKGELYCYDSWSDRSSVAPQPLSRYSVWYTGYVYRNDSKDTTPPSITNVKVTNVTSMGYTVTCTATDNVGVTKVEFPTWRVSDTSAGCTWYQGSRNGNTWSFTYTGAAFEDNYLTHIYAFDADGNQSCVSAGVVFCKRQESVYPVVDGGIYEIQSYLADNKVMDVDSASSNEGANIHLFTRNGTNAQKFKIISVGNGYYKMIAMCSGKAVDVYTAQRTNGANVGQYSYNGTDAQLFRFVSAGNGYCYIISKLGSFIDVKGGGTADGTNIQTWGFGSIANQSWKLNLMEATAYFSDYKLNKVTDDNAELYIKVQNPNREEITSAGCELYDEEGNLLKSYSENCNWTISYINYNCNFINDMHYTLSPGTTYKAILYAVVGGKRINDTVRTFTTTGTKNNAEGKNEVEDNPATVESTPTPAPTPKLPSATSTPTPQRAKEQQKSQKSNQAETSQVTNKTADDTFYKKTVEKPSKVTGLKLKNVKGRKIKVSWKGKKNISGGYQIQYAQNRTFTKNKKNKNCSGTGDNKTISGFRKGKTYYVRVRAYNKEEGKVYGAWSSVKKVKVRK